MSPSTFLLIFISVLLNTSAQILLKISVNTVGEITFDTKSWITIMPQLLSQWSIWAGLTCYAISLVVWIIGLSRIEVSLAYPMLSLGYIINAFAAWYLLGESLPIQRLAAISLILLGVYLLAHS